MKILALDLGKFKSVACTYDKGSAEHEFQKTSTTPREVRALSAYLATKLIEHAVRAAEIDAGQLTIHADRGARKGPPKAGHPSG